MLNGWTLPKDAVSKIANEGYLLTSVGSSGALAKIKSEISAWKDTPAVNGYGCLYAGGDALLQNLALFSPTALKLALSDDILDLMEAIFGQPAVLAKIEYRRALNARPEMPLHSDGRYSFSFFLYLNGIDADAGATYVIPNTHKIGIDKNDGYLQVPKEAQLEVGGEEIVARGEPGTCLIMNDLAWHGRTESKHAGREIVWFNFLPEDAAESGVNLVYSVNAICDLSPRQLRAIGIGANKQRNGSSEDFMLSHNLSYDSLELLPRNFIAKAAIRNVARRAYSYMPLPIRKLVRGVLGVDAKQRKFKKVGAAR